MQIKKLAVTAAAAGALALSLVTASPASADYAPGSGDVVGVGSDTVQFAIDFLADGDYTGVSGYNVGQKNRVVNFDATPDANARLAYGAYGVGSASATALTGPGATSATNFCAPGTGGLQGTGNQNAPHTGDKPCTLNPTVVLRAGLKPVQRPNGSGAGYNALKADDVAGSHNIDFARASSPRGANALYDSVIIGKDTLAMLASSTTNSIPLTAAQLTSVYNCTTTDWNTLNPAAPVGSTIRALVPQVGSGTRSSFLGAIGLTESTIGACAINVEENDAEAIDGSGSAVNAIEPMSSGRLNMYLGKDGAGVSQGLGGYFTDPSCQYGYAAAACKAPATTAGNLLTPNVQLYTTAPAWSSVRNMYVYFRHADVSTAAAFQPGSTRNWVRTLFYNPCSGSDLNGTPIVNGTNCTSGGTYGPGGAPYIVNNPALVSSAGIDPTGYAFTLAGP